MAAFLLRAASSRDLILFSFPDRNSVFLCRAMILASLQTWVVKDFLLAAKSIAVMIAFRPFKVHSIFCLKLWSESSENGVPWNPCSEQWAGLFAAVSSSVRNCSTNMHIIIDNDEIASVTPSFGSAQNLLWLFLWKTFSTTKIDLASFGQNSAISCWLFSDFIL